MTTKMNDDDERWCAEDDYDTCVTLRKPLQTSEGRSGAPKESTTIPEYTTMLAARSVGQWRRGSASASWQEFLCKDKEKESKETRQRLNDHQPRAKGSGMKHLRRSKRQGTRRDR